MRPSFTPVVAALTGGADVPAAVAECCLSPDPLHAARRPGEAGGTAAGAGGGPLEGWQTAHADRAGGCRALARDGLVVAHRQPGHERLVRLLERHPGLLRVAAQAALLDPLRLRDHLVDEL